MLSGCVTDLVVLLLEGKLCFAIVVEVQLSRDEDKRKTWPLCLTSLRSRVSCPTALLVVAPDAAVARWCAQPIELGHPGFMLQPLVMGSLSEAARGALEALMQRGTYEYQSEFALKYVAQGREEGRKVDLWQLKRWLRKAVSVQSTEELFTQQAGSGSAE